jgi:hypothetical protein
MILDLVKHHHTRTVTEDISIDSERASGQSGYFTGMNAYRDEKREGNIWRRSR